MKMAPTAGILNDINGLGEVFGEIVDPHKWLQNGYKVNATWFAGNRYLKLLSQRMLSTNG